MLPRKHFILGLIFSGILVYFFDFSLIAGAIVLLSSVLIDIDHYFYYVHKKNDWGLKNSYNWFVEHGKKLKRLDLKERKKIYTGFYFLHGIEVLFILFLLGDFLHPYFLFVLFGFAFHLMLDIFHNFFYGHTRLDKFSIIYDYFKYKKLKFIEEADGI